jgi:hypothetical protein
MRSGAVKNALAAGVIFALAGCGSSRLSVPTNGFRSATHHYSVGEVEAAFAKHGIALHKASQQFPDAVSLISGSGSRAVFVSVLIHPTTAAYPIPIPVEQKTLHGNLTVAWSLRDNAVSASLGELH